MSITLEEENILLQTHYDKVTAFKSPSSPNHKTTVKHTAAHPRITSVLTPEQTTSFLLLSTETNQSDDPEAERTALTDRTESDSKGNFMDEINSLFAAAGSI